MAYENILIVSLPIIIIIVIVVRRIVKTKQRVKTFKPSGTGGSFGGIQGSTNPSKLDDTQFYACPNCGGNISTKNNKQFCSNCNQFL